MQFQVLCLSTLYVLSAGSLQEYSSCGLELNFFIMHLHHTKDLQKKDCTTTITLGEFIAFYNGTLVLLLSFLVVSLVRCVKK